ncbi:hypothetical protein ALC62_01573 [Cyphomyrmex costatus]|uniref:Uncharacterized protein n=1 Tax=Cyphomyrmex costatus TaxID=456900 RepID=A0A195D3D5_9HYME|nr:hypothetical protein ALC62_01573 [Cyphomyrmex costatus]
MHSGRLGSRTYRKAGYRIHRHPCNVYLSGGQTSDRQRAKAPSWNPDVTSSPRIRRREHPCGAIPFRGVVGAAVPHEQLDSLAPRVVGERFRAHETPFRKLSKNIDNPPPRSKEIPILHMNFRRDWITRCMKLRNENGGFD